MSTYLDKVNAAFNAFYKLFSDAVTAGTLKNASAGIPINLSKRVLPKNIRSDFMPLVTVVRVIAASGGADTDQPIVTYPDNVTCMIGVADYDMQDPNYADIKTDYIINVILGLMDADPSLGGLINGMRITQMRFDSDADEEVYLSTPSMMVLLELKR